VYYQVQRSVVRFLWAKGLNAKDIHKDFFPDYGGKCLSRKAAHNLVEKFSQGCSKAADVARPGRLVQIATEATLQQVKSRYEDNDTQCTRVFSWFSIQHNA
jgi:hypothetical protein